MFYYDEESSKLIFSPPLEDPCIDDFLGSELIANETGVDFRIKGVTYSYVKPVVKDCSLLSEAEAAHVQA